MAWFYLLLAGLMEIGWAVALKQSQQFSQLIPTILFLICSPLSFLLLMLALKEIPLGTGYAIWTGIGAAGVAIIGIIFLGEPLNIPRVFFLTLIITGIIGLKFTV